MKRFWKRRFISFFLAAVMLAALVPAALFDVRAADSTGTFDLGTGTWTDGSSAACTWEDPVLTVGSGAHITITGESTDFRRIVVAEDAKEVHITLNGVVILGLDAGQSPLLLHDGADVLLTAADGSVNLLFGGNACAGIQVPAGAALSVDGTGALQVFGGEGASGIGAGAGGTCGLILIANGNVDVTGGGEPILPSEQSDAPSILLSVENSGSDTFSLSWTTLTGTHDYTLETSLTGEDDDYMTASFYSLSNPPTSLCTVEGLSFYPENTVTYFRVSAPQEEGVLYSNVVQMAYTEGAGYVQMLNGEPGEGAVQFDAGDEYALSFYSKLFSINDLSFCAEFSFFLQKKNHSTFVHGFSCEPYAYDSGAFTDSPYDGTSGFTIEYRDEFDFSVSGYTLDLLYLYDSAPSALVAAPYLCKSVPKTTPDGLYYSLHPLSDDAYQCTYNPETGVLSVTLFEPGHYVLMQDAVSFEPLLPPEPPVVSEWQPSSKLAEILHEAGFSFDPASGLLYARKDASQRNLGFSYFYDEGIPLISSNISCEPIYFIYDDKEWLIEIWKGQYGIELGAEIGVYNRTVDGHLVKDRINKNYKTLVEELFKQIEAKYFSVPDRIKEVLDTVTDSITPVQFENALQTAFNIAKDLAKIDPTGVADFVRDMIGVLLFGLRSKLYDCVSDADCLLMQYTLYNKRTPLFQRGTEMHWWLTGFDWGQYTQDPNSLTMDATIWFPSETMRDAFINGYDDFESKMVFEEEDKRTVEPFAFYNNDNVSHMARGLKNMGYKVVDDIDNYFHDELGYWLPLYQLLPDDGTCYGVRFTVTRPQAVQPFFTSTMASFVNLNNANLVSMYRALKRIIGCDSNDPNLLEDCVLRYTGEDEAFVQRAYALITDAIVQVVDAAFSIAKAAVGPKPLGRSLAQGDAQMLSGITGAAAALDGAVPFNLMGGADDAVAGIGGVDGDIRITGGMVTVNAPLGYGIYGGTITITGGSVYVEGAAGAVSPQPKNGADVPVYMVKLTIADMDPDTPIAEFILPAGYSAAGMVYDPNGLYIWLPAGTQRVTLKTNDGEYYTGIVDVTEDGKAVLTLTEHSHVYTHHWTTDDTAHWDVCDCGAVLLYGAHNGGAATCTEDGVCLTCHTAYIAAPGHALFAVPALAATCIANGNTAHWRCVSCGACFADAAGNEMISLLNTLLLATGHTGQGEWHSDGDGHWQLCVCAEKTDTGAHTPGDWIVASAATQTEDGSRYKACTVCGYVTETERIPATGGGAVDPDVLERAVSHAEAQLQDASIGDQPGQYPPDSAAALRDAIDQAKRVLNDPDALQVDIDQANNALYDAVCLFEESKIPLGPVDPETGDGNAAVWFLLCGVSLAGLAGIVLPQRKRRRSTR